MALTFPTTDSTDYRPSASRDSDAVLMDGRGRDITPASARDYSSHWKVLLGEFIHLLALFWVHSRSAGVARASEVLFNQLLQHLSILGKMPNHTGDILVRRVQHQLGAVHSAPNPDYIVIFGNLLINSQEEGNSDVSQQFSHLKSALGRACQCFAEQEIHSLLLRLPGKSTESIEQFRFSLHILTRYFMAARDGNSIAFRYYGRSLVVPVISDLHGTPDPNLTLMAALNGLSTVNARELIRQARAYAELDGAEPMDDGGAQSLVSAYDQIFKVRSLRAQVIKPPVEINNLLFPHEAAASPGRSSRGRTLFIDKRSGSQPSVRDPEPDCGIALESHIAHHPELAGILGLLSSSMKGALDELFADDYARLDLTALGNRFASLSRLFYAIEKQCQDPAVMAAAMDILRTRLKAVAVEVMANLVAQRQGLKIVSQGRSVLVGMVHPNLYDLIVLTKEDVVARQRMAIIKQIAFQMDPCHINLLAHGFAIAVSDAHQIFKLLQGSFSTSGRFVRPTFESRVDAMSRHENVIFEILWCLLRQTAQRNDRLDFLNAIQLLMARLNDPKRALQLLMADICLNPEMVFFTDRNAFALANILLHKENKELYVDVHRTPEDVLNRVRPLNPKVRNYAHWRLDVDHGRFLVKMRTIASNILKVVAATPETGPWPFELAFLLALEREAIIFAALVKGPSARLVIREALDRYGDPNAPTYQSESISKYLPLLIPHLQIVMRALGVAGDHDDIERLTSLERRAKMLIDLDTHPAHGLRVKQMMKWVPRTLEAIQSNGSQLLRI
jgi:hypothetical protein